MNIYNYGVGSYTIRCVMGDPLQPQLGDGVSTFNISSPGLLLLTSTLWHSKKPIIITFYIVAYEHMKQYLTCGQSFSLNDILEGRSLLIEGIIWILERATYWSCGMLNMP